MASKTSPGPSRLTSGCASVWSGLHPLLGPSGVARKLLLKLSAKSDLARAMHYALSRAVDDSRNQVDHNATERSTFEEHGANIQVVLNDNGREFCGRPDQHPYELLLQLEDIEHRTTHVKRPQSNSITERLHCTVLDEHIRVEGHRTWFETIDEVQASLDDYLVTYNTKRPHRGRGMNGRTPITVFKAGLPKTIPQKKEKTHPQKSDSQLAQLYPPAATLR